VSNRNQRRRRWSHKSKSVTTTEEIVIGRLLKGIFVIVAVALAAYMTMQISRR
jgi:hypothetical protein